jgi:hypothetical protein
MLLSDLPIRDRVANGAAWLDEHAPGWEAKFDLDTLEIAEGCNCVLGQVYGHYFKAPDEARWDLDDRVYLAVERGFNGHDADMPALNAAWRALVAARR